MSSVRSTLEHELAAIGSAEKAAHSIRFFRTGPGDYGEGDRFLGVTVPETRRVARVVRTAVLDDIGEALDSPFHEVRLAALFTLVYRFERAGEAERREILDLYLEKRDCVNNWDLVDSSAPQIVGGWIATGGDPNILDELMATEVLWDTRIAILATLSLIRVGEYKPTLALCRRVLSHPHDLIHKASGWMLREVGKRDPDILRRFLADHAGEMPRTMLRYAIEKLPAEERKAWLSVR